MSFSSLSPHPGFRPRARVSWISCWSSPVPRLGDEPPASLHLHIQASLHAAHLHVLVEVPVHVIFGCSQFQLFKENSAKMIPGHVVGMARPRAVTHITSDCSSIVSPSPRDSLPHLTPFCATPPPFLPSPTSIWSMVSWYSFSRLLNSDSVSLITFSRLSSCC